MALTRKPIATVLFAAGAAVVALTGAPTASASGADDVIADLQSDGYLVNVNYLNGASKGLSQCTVTRIDNPSSSPKPGDTVYVDVTCPNHDDDDGFGFGVGIG